ncbi:ABC transporter ATP-binding protein [Wenyingzhuangia sp. IMCC45574]
MQDYILSIEDLQKTYKDKVALNSISTKVPKGSIYGLIGQNGAGKTTLIRILNKIIEADSGCIYFKDRKMTSKEVAKVGYLPEERGLYKNMSIEEQALYFGQLKGMSKKEASISLDYWLDRFGISDWKRKKIEDLSKGMAQKVQFIITVLHKPDLLILDEPFSGFDPINANLIANEIKELAAKGTTVIFSSHRMESVAEMCDALCLIHQGNILLEGSIETIQKENSQAVYEIGLLNYSEEQLAQFLDNTNYETNITTKNETTIHLEVIDLLENKEQLQKAILNIGTLELYKQHIPSLQEIFIKTIENA